MVDWAPLGELGEIVAGSTPSTHVKEYWDGDIPWITPADLTDYRGVYFTGELRKITKPGYDSCSTRMLPAGSILYSTRAPIGHCVVSAFPLCTNQGFKSIIPNERLNAVYGYYALRFLTPEIIALGRGATFGEVNKEIFESVKLPLPSLAEQHRIAGILGRADRLRRKRRYAQQMSETFLQAVFVRMFYWNAKRDWPQATVESLAKKGKTSIRTGPFGSQLKHSEFHAEGSVAVLGIDNAVENRFVWGKPRFISEEKYKELQRYTVFPGDLIITIMATTGRCAVIPEKFPRAINTKHLCCITLDQRKALPTFLQHCFLYHPVVLRQMGVSERGAVMPGLNMEITKNISLPLPPLALQQQFARVVQQFERLRVQQREAERQAEQLFQALLHRAFSGA